MDDTYAKLIRLLDEVGSTYRLIDHAEEGLLRVPLRLLSG